MLCVSHPSNIPSAGRTARTVSTFLPRRPPARLPAAASPALCCPPLLISPIPTAAPAPDRRGTRTTGLECQCSKHSRVKLPICAHALPEATLHAPLPGKARHTGRWPVPSEHKNAENERAQETHARQVRSCTSRMEPHREEPDDDPDALPLPGFPMFNLQG